MKQGNTDTLRKSVVVRAMEGQKSFNVRNVEKHHGQCWTRSYASSHKDSKKDGWKGDRRGNGKGTQKGGKSKGGKGGNQEKVKERKDNISTKTQNLQKNSRQVDLGTNGQTNLGLLKKTLRVGGDMIVTQQIRILKHQRQLRNFNMCLSVNCDFRAWVLPNMLNLCSLTDWILRIALSHLVLIPKHAKLLFLPVTLLQVDMCFTKILYLDVRKAQQAETKCVIKERGSCAPQMEQESQWPKRAEKSTVDDR